MSDRIAVMNEGVIEQLAQPRDIYEHPKTRFVAGFIGTSNLLGGTVTRSEAGIAVIDFGDGDRIIVPAVDARPGDKLETTVRPEKITLTSGDTSNPGGGQGGAAGAGSGRENACALRGSVTEVV
jgi:spermidine/putrescine transport system ATP-binding protein